ncbi:MAG TPA: glutamyl-tRNA reductase, partial [bacterium]|nr:glutamyl-tRNA reductase [bacterium]
PLTTKALPKARHHVYCKTNKEAVRHLFEVTSSLDSQVIGENQITNQVKKAYLTALSSKTTGGFLNKLFERALFVSKRVKTETDISRGNLSLGSAAVMLAKRIFGSLSNASVLLLGLGEIGQQVVRALNGHNTQKTWLMTRSLTKATEQEALGLGIARPLETLCSALSEADIVITALSETLPELTVGSLEKALTCRKDRPLFMIDLGVPRNVDVTVATLENVYLYNLDDLRHISEETLKSRTNTLCQAKNIIDEETALFYGSSPTQKGPEPKHGDGLGLLKKFFRLDDESEL